MQKERESIVHCLVTIRIRRNTLFVFFRARIREKKTQKVTRRNIKYLARLSPLINLTQDISTKIIIYSSST